MGLNGKVDALAIQNKWITDFLKTQGLTATAVQTELANMTASRDALQVQLTAMMAAIDAANNTITARDATIVSLNNAKTNLQNSITALTSNLDEMTAQSDFYQEAYDMLHLHDTGNVRTSHALIYDVYSMWYYSGFSKKWMIASDVCGEVENT